MRNIKLSLFAAACVTLAAGASAFAQAPDEGDTGDDSPVTCPTPSQQTPQAQPAAPAQPAPVAQYTPPPQPQYTQPPQYAPAYTAQPSYETSTMGMGAGTIPGIGLAVGGGVDGFVHNHVGLSDVGGSWTARLTIGTRSYVAGEISYIGSAQSINTLVGSSTLIGNGAQAVLRLNATVDYPVQPFIFGGAAWRHYNVSSNAANVSDFRDNNDALEVPLGLGIAGYWQGLMLDARGEYRFGWTEHNLSSDFTDNRADRWGVTGNIGFSF